MRRFVAFFGLPTIADCQSLAGVSSVITHNGQLAEMDSPPTRRISTITRAWRRGGNIQGREVHMIENKGVVHFTITVSDIGRSEAF